MRIGILGGVPAALGGGGLEVQIAQTAAALERRGHDVVRVETAGPAADWDVLHAFGAEGNVQFAVHHWTRASSPLVISPVLVISPGTMEWAQHATARFPVVATAAAERRRLLRRADALIAITGYEARVLRRQVGRRARVSVIPNGVQIVAPGAGGGEADGVLLLGAVSRRKRQREALEALAGTSPIVVAGPFSGEAGERRAWEAALATSGARWLGHVDRPDEVARLLTDAAVLVHWSEAEVQSLAVLEAIAYGTPAVVSDIPSHRELAAAYPGWVRVATDAESLRTQVALARRSPPAGPAPRPATWDDVAALLEPVYERVR